jgi:hypothetical protein
MQRDTLSQLLAQLIKYVPMSASINNKLCHQMMHINLKLDTTMVQLNDIEPITHDCIQDIFVSTVGSAPTVDQ